MFVCMVNHTSGLHHYHIRKRIHQKHEVYPSPKKSIRFMDKAVYIVGIIGPLMTIPQLMKIWIEQNVSGISILSWGTYLFTALFWLVYGIIHKEKPLIFMYSLWVLVEIFVVIGIAIYA